MDLAWSVTHHRSNMAMNALSPKILVITFGLLVTSFATPADAADAEQAAA
jgi:hypothetical protein